MKKKKKKKKKIFYIQVLVNFIFFTIYFQCSRAICKFAIDSDGNRGVVFENWNELLSLVQNSLDQLISHGMYNSFSS
jgi:hypothetical protein